MAQNDIGNLGGKTSVQAQLSRPMSGQNEIKGVGNNPFNRSKAGGGAAQQSFLKGQERSNQRREDITRLQGMQDYANTRNQAADAQQQRNLAMQEQQEDIRMAYEDFQDALERYVDDVDYRIRTIQDQMAYEDQQDQLAMQQYIGDTRTQQRGQAFSDYLSAGVGAVSYGMGASNLRKAASAASSVYGSSPGMNNQEYNGMSAVRPGYGAGMGPLDSLKGLTETTQVINPGMSQSDAANFAAGGGYEPGYSPTDFSNMAAQRAAQQGDTVNRISPIPQATGLFSSVLGTSFYNSLAGSPAQSSGGFQEGQYDHLPYRGEGGAFDRARRAGYTTWNWRGQQYGTDLDPNWRERWGD